LQVEKFFSKKEDIISTLNNLAIDIEEKDGAETAEELVSELFIFKKWLSRSQGLHGI